MIVFKKRAPNASEDGTAPVPHRRFHPPNNSERTCGIVAMCVSAATFFSVTGLLSVWFLFSPEFDSVDFALPLIVSASAFVPGSVSSLVLSSVPIPSIPNSTGFGACLLVKDDNDKLPEWIAYHHTILPLRRLVVAVDPTSASSPSEILGRWNASGRVRVTEWGDADFMPARLRRSQVRDGLKLHEERQRFFFGRCAEALRDGLLRDSGGEPPGWAVFLDSDEFVAFNRRHRGHSGEKDNSGCRDGWKTTGGEGLDASSRDALPHRGAPTTVEEFVAHTSSSSSSSPARALPWAAGCVSMPRLLFGNAESSAAAVHAGTPPGGPDPQKFTTLRFRHHSRPGIFETSRFGKVLLDLGALPPGRVEVPNPHIVSHLLCIRPPVPCYGTAPLRVHHYVGSWESYSSRGGYVGRTRKDFETKGGSSAVDYGEDDDTRGWMETFVASLGEKEAQRLTEGAGVVTTWAKLAQNREEFRRGESEGDFLVPAIKKLKGKK
mmetsp:Transcript_36820/g.72410  ORF Transcript_36820/g.72410 Transcript_36820/m.72410 type:complete len:492 (-) Transcript_36820:460-1935(-)